MTTYAIIQFSIGILLTVPVVVLERTPVRRLYAAIFRGFGQQEPTPLPAT